MISISRLKLRNFKSFKIIDIPVPRTFLCFAGPNGSGKSNIQDGIRFALGETSLKSLRAKRARDLIHHGSNTAEVTILFDGDEKYEIKRAIRQDGKILYKINGKKATRTSVHDTLKQYNLDESGRNIIAQGEVQRIISMGGKERRTIIDSVAGIANFEDKKKEALRELEVVESRIKDANLVLGERIAFLNELEKEKESALIYIENKKNLTNAKATLLKNELERIEKELRELLELEKKISFNASNKQAEFAALENQILELDNKRLDVSKQLQQKQQTAPLIRKIEELKASVSSKKQMVLDREEYLKKIEDDENSLKKETKKENDSLAGIEKELERLKQELKLTEQEATKYGKEKTSSEVEQLRTNIKELETKLYSNREKLVATEAELNANTNLIDVKTNELDSIKISSDSNEATMLNKEKDSIKKQISSIEKEIEDCFKRTKEINAEVADIDRKLLEFKEKVSLLRVRVSPTYANPALKFIADMREKGEKGVHGVVADMIKFDSKYATAIEAAAGNRLLYVIVDDANVAAKTIERLKKANAGRATFIPLKEIRSSSTKPTNGCEPLINFVKYSDPVRKAVEFVFGDTLLVNNIEEAKKIGIGTARMVSLEGEIFERSGLITGGKVESNILAAVQLKKLDAELEELKKKKESLVNELFSIREEESQKRSQKSEFEIKAKTIELTVKQDELRRKDEQELLNRRNAIVEYIEKLKSIIKEKQQHKEQLNNEISSLAKKLTDLAGILDKAEFRAKETSDAEQTKRTEIASRLSSIRATYEGKLNELEIRKREVFTKDEKIKEIEKEKKEIVTKIVEFKKQLSNDNAELEKSEQDIAHHSRAIEKLFEAMKKYEEELQNFGKLRGEKRLEIDKLTKDENQLSVKKATYETRSQDLKAEFSNYKEFEELKLGKDGLTDLIKKSEETITTLGNVNIAAIELYEKKHAEIGEVKERIEKLSEERNAVLNMIAELEERKKESFFETFYAVSDNFKRMFKHINIGEGFLYLDKPNEPFESGLYIKLKRGGKEHTLDSLSGGENSLVALMFIFALQFFKPAPFYILDEVDAALDKENSKNLAQLISNMSRDTQFLVVSHNDIVMSSAEAVIGVTKVDGTSKLVGVKLEAMNA
ncbi:AAA family ATPase [Candidatus Micrarchaeota archaeon]|nr:AAA family ATPase [Candidatus Micrarchaeota archaeon]